MARLTKRIVDAQKPNGKDFFLWDEDIPGFGLRVFSSGRKSYVVQYRKDGRSRRVTLGAHGVLTPDQARTKARITLGEVANGEDPAERRLVARKDPTINQLCDLYLKEGPEAKPQKKESSWQTDRSNIKRHIRPLLGTRKLRSLTKRDIERFQADVTSGKSATVEKTNKKRGKAVVRGGKGTGWRATVVLSAMLSFAVDRGLRPDNPARGVQLNKLESRTRFLSSDEMKKLGEVLTEEAKDINNTWIVAAIRLLMLTGCRKSEILTLKWSYVDRDHNLLRLPDSKTGAKAVPVGQAAMDLIEEIPKLEGSEYVLPSLKGDGPLVGLQKAWERIREKAAIADVRIHDFRHTFASIAAVNGESLLVLSKVLGHRQTRTTEKYAHLTNSPLIALSERTAKTIETHIGRLCKDSLG